MYLITYINNDINICDHYLLILKNHQIELRHCIKPSGKHYVFLL
jgi:hypothetical protein